MNRKHGNSKSVAGIVARLMLLVMTLAMLSGAVGCVGNLGNSLSMAVLNQDDPETVRDGAPAFLILVDSLIENDPEDVDSLIAGAKLYALYAGVFTDSPARALRLASRAKNYGMRALCLQDKVMCAVSSEPYDVYTAALAKTVKRDVPALYAASLGWLVWIKADSGNWSAMADLPKVEAALERVVELDPEYDAGNPWLYLGILNSLRPPSLGGKPEKARAAFEKAQELSGGKNLAVDVAYAEYYARLLYEQDLHDRLLVAALAADPVAPGLTLGNVLAQQRAKELLESSPDYF